MSVNIYISVNNYNLLKIEKQIIFCGRFEDQQIYIF